MINKEIVIDLYIKQNKSFNDVCRELNITKTQLQYALRKYGVFKKKEMRIKLLETNSKTRRIHHPLLDDKEALYKAYIVENKTRSEIAKICNVSDGLIKEKLRSFKISKPVELYHKNVVKGCADLQKQIIEKRKKTCLKKYGVEHYVLHEDFSNKARKTLKERNSWTVSKKELLIYDLLIKRYREVKTQYKSKLYPFNCDFYIPEKDLYIEYQGTWTHGNKPFDENDENDIMYLNMMKIKANNSDYYKSAISTWTIRDPLKRETARKNNLNWIEFFNMNEFMEWYNEN